MLQSSTVHCKTLCKTIHYNVRQLSYSPDVGSWLVGRTVHAAVRTLSTCSSVIVHTVAEEFVWLYLDIGKTDVVMLCHK